MPGKDQHRSDQRPERVFSISAGIYAWLLPGLGHISVGQKRRGRLIMFGVFFLVGVGVLVGGVNVVDRQSDFLWFVAQACCGPISFAIDFVNQWVLTSRTEAGAYRAISVASVNEVGTLFVALAGLMNLTAIIDATFHLPETTGRVARRSSDA